MRHRTAATVLATLLLAGCADAADDPEPVADNGSEPEEEEVASRDTDDTPALSPTAPVSDHRDDEATTPLQPEEIRAYPPAEERRAAEIVTDATGNDDAWPVDKPELIELLDEVYSDYYEALDKRDFDRLTDVFTGDNPDLERLEFLFTDYRNRNIVLDRRGGNEDILDVEVIDAFDDEIFARVTHDFAEEYRWENPDTGHVEYTEEHPDGTVDLLTIQRDDDGVWEIQAVAPSAQE